MGTRALSPARAAWTAASLTLILAFLIAKDAANGETNRGESGGPGILLSDTVYSWSTAQSVIPHVECTATEDTSTGTWRYEYELTNDTSSSNSLAKFALAPIEQVIAISGPTHWYGTVGYQDRADAVAWAVIDAGAPPAEWDSVSLYPSEFDLQPGEGVSGFVIVSNQAPGTITYYAKAFIDLPDLEEPDPPTIFENSATGTTIGPGGSTTDVPKGGQQPRTSLHPSYPNPTRGLASIVFQLNASANVTVVAYDVSGRRVRTIASGTYGPGIHSVSWDSRADGGTRVPSGVYFYRLLLDGEPVGSRRIVIVN